MKFFLILLGGITMMAVGYLMLNNAEIAKLSAHELELTRKAAALGVASSEEDSPRRLHLRKRPIGSIPTGEQIFSFSKAVEEGMEEGEWVVKMPREGIRFQETLRSLSRAQMKDVFRSIKEQPGIAGDTRIEMLSLLLDVMAGKDPEGALQLIRENPMITKRAEQTADAAIQQWAETDPWGAVKWLKKYRGARPDLITDRMTQAMLRGASKTDYVTAFGILRELGDSQSNAFRGILEAVRTLEQGDAALAAMKEHLETEEDPVTKKRLTNSFSIYVADIAKKAGFAEGSQWIDNAEFSPDVLGIIVRQSRQMKPDDNGRWMEWIAARVPDENGREGIMNLASRWAQSDHAAAAEWLNNSPGGMMKNAAVEGFVAAVATEDPESALRWAETLPESEAKHSLLRAIRKKETGE